VPESESLLLTNIRGGAHIDSRRLPPWPNQILHFNPEQDTIFLRSLDNYRANDLGSIIDRFHGIHNIQHLAVPLEQKGIPTRKEWHKILNSMPVLKTLTFMLGSKEKSWRGTQRGIELRDFEQWFVDGRSRDVCRGNGGKVDVKDVESHMRTTTAAIGGLYEFGSKARNRTVNVRVVAWKRGSRV
jgi:hypothetical protein